MSKTREQFPLSTKKIYKKTLATIFSYGLLFLLPGISLLTFILIGIRTPPTIVTLVTVMDFSLFAILTILTFFYQKWYFAVYFYDLTPDYIVIKKNPITPTEITIPYERIQDIYMDQDLLDRFFGLYDVHLSSATVSSGMEAKIDGVEKVAAGGLRTLLLQKVQEKISKKQEALPPNLSSQKR